YSSDHRELHSFPTRRSSDLHKSAEDRSVNVWKEGPIPTNQAIRGFYSVTLSEEGYERTASVLTDELGFMPTRQDGTRFRFEIPTDRKSTRLNSSHVAISYAV